MEGVLNLFAALGRLLPSSGLALSIVLLVIVVQATVDYADDLTPVTVVVDGVSRQLRTRCSTVGEVLGDLGVSTESWDHVTPDRQAPVWVRMTIAVQHAQPVTVVVDGAARTVHTHSQAVDAILHEAGVDLGPGDRLRVNGVWVTGGRDVQQAAFDLLSGRSSGRRVASLYAESSRGGKPRRNLSPVSHIEVQRAAIIHLNDGGVEHTLYTTASTLGRALAEAQVLLYLGDRVHPSLDTPVTTGLRVRVQRGVPVSVVVDGRTLHTRTQRRSVGEVLAELGVSLMGKDFVEPALDARAQEGLRIRVVRVAERTIVEQEEIPFETEWMPDPSLELDHRRLDDVGANGIARRRYKAVYHNGEEVERYLEEQWIAREPQPRRIAYGTRIVVRTLETSDGPIEYWRRIRVFLTSYSAATCGKTPDHPQYGVTRLGWKMRHGIIAVDPMVIRLRSQLYVPGYGPGIAGDTGGLVKGRHIDLGYEEDNLIWHYEWGYVYVLTPVPPSSQIPWVLPDYPRER